MHNASGQQYHLTGPGLLLLLLNKNLNVPKHFW
jgi:hypothetical protein